MAVLTQQQLEGLKQRHESVSHGYGYPSGMITDLLQTIQAMTKEKKKWKRLAEKRGDALNRALKVLEIAKEPEEDL